MMKYDQQTHLGVSQIELRLFTIGSNFQWIMTSIRGLLDRPKSLVADTSNCHYISDPAKEMPFKFH